MPETLYNTQLVFERVDLKEKSEEGLIHSLPDLKTILDSKVSVEFFEGSPYYVVKRNALSETAHAFLKRGFDIIFSGLVVVFILSWLTPIFALLIKLDSKGPIFYRQRRSGRNDKPFHCLKFRTMCYVKDAEFKPATKNDDRVTKIGRFLRKTSLDEFPQFFNVFIGDMSIVGPRPHVFELNDKFKHKVEKYMLRNVVKPGLTGLSQVKGYRGEISTAFGMKQRVKIDIFYIENWSFLLDIKIILQTGYIIFKGDQNAY